MTEESEKVSSRASQGEVDITGRVLQVDIRTGTFEIWPDGEEKITAAFTEEQESKVLAALGRHSHSHTQVCGQGEYIDGKLKRIVKVDTIRTFLDKRPRDPNAPRIEDVIAERWSKIPQEELDRIPHDLIERLDYYLYGIER